MLRHQLRDAIKSRPGQHAEYGTVAGSYRAWTNARRPNDGQQLVDQQTGAEFYSVDAAVQGFANDISGSSSAAKSPSAGSPQTDCKTAAGVPDARS